MNKPTRKSLASKARVYSKETALFIAIAVLFMLLIHVFVLRSFDVFESKDDATSQMIEDMAAVGEPLYGQHMDYAAIETPRQPAAEFGLKLEDGLGVEPYIYPLYAEFYPYDGAAEDEEKVVIYTEEEQAIDDALNDPQAIQYSLSNPNAEKARIAIMIDDVGMNRAQSRAVVAMDEVPLTLAFLPYAPDLKSLTVPAQEAGHELMIHMPMEPVSSKVPLGPIAIKDEMSADEVKAMLEKAYASFDGYMGLNNHMGSRVTQNKELMDVVMDSLDARGLFYVDSKTISTSVAADAAREQGIAHAERDIFLDHEETLEFARGALKRLERVALEKGHAIAIGHPKENTVAALKEWIPTLEARGFEIVPVSELLMRPSSGNVSGGILMANAETQLSAPKKPKKKLRHKPKKTRAVSAPKFILDEPVSVEEIARIEPSFVDDLARIEPAAGDEEDLAVEVKASEPVKQAKAQEPEIDVEAEDLLSAPIGVSNDAEAEGISSGLYSLSD